MNREEQGGSSSSERSIRIFRAIAVLAFATLLGYFVYTTTVSEGSAHPFKFGLDLAGGSQLVYVADVSSVNENEVPELMETLREIIERRVNVFGVAEPNVQTEKSSFVSGGDAQQRLIVELPGVTDIDEAVEQIGKTPLLEFKLVDQEALAAQNAVDNINASNTGAVVNNVRINGEEAGEPYKETGLTGRYLKRAELVFGNGNQSGLSNEPIVSIEFNEEGAALFANITANNVGEQLAIFLDGTMMSAPRINEGISGGRAVISGNFTPEEARDLVRNLNFGALPVPITLDSTQTIGSTLGEEALQAGIYAGVIGFILLSVFMILWYRLPGLIAVVALVIYVVMMLALFKLIPVVLTAAGIAGLILSIGLAVDANILIAERIKEELREGKTVDAAIKEGFARAWLAIRDSNITHIIAAVILFWFGTSLIKGFALVLGIGVVISMLSAITISRTLLIIIPVKSDTAIGKFLMSSGISR
jgi:preprotein translocase subunit SecD